MNDKSLKFIALSGTVSVTENLYVYETKDEMFVMDCGVGFPDLEMPGVDLVLPDFSYIVKNKNKLKGILLSQGHEDHIGAVPFLLKDVNVPIHCAPLVERFLLDKFKDFGTKTANINVFNPDKDEFKIGSFTIHPFRVAHSVPDSCGFAIDTPIGRIFHVPEHKMDQNPVDGMAFDIKRAKELASGGRHLFLASDCLGSNKPGRAPSELEIEDNMLKIAKTAKSTIFATAISSNIGRFQQMINVAQKVGRKVVLVGRSVVTKVGHAHDLGYLKYLPNTVIDQKSAKDYSEKQLMYIVSGCYGQVGSSLYRLATGEYDGLEVQKGDTLIFSADPAPPYSKESQDYVIDEFIDKGLDVHYYDLHEGLYVSGHGYQDDITALFDIVKPKYFIPIGGTTRFMKGYEDLVMKLGKDESSVFKLKPGDNIIFENETAKKGNKIPTKSVLVHGLGIGDVGKVVLGDRSQLGTEGVVVVIFKLDKNKNLLGVPEIVTRGFVYEGKSKNLLGDAVSKLTSMVKSKNYNSPKQLKEMSIKFLGNHFYKITARRPMILPVVVEV